MERNPIETVMGAVVLLVAAFFLALAYKTGDFHPSGKTYEIQGAFTKIGGLEVGSDVRINGVKVGSVKSRYLDENNNYRAVVVMNINENIELPKDTAATIVNDGFMGGQYVRLQPGSSQTMMSAGSSLEKIENFSSIEDMISEIIYLATNPDNGPATTNGSQK